MSSKSKSDETFKKGDKVTAKWSGSNSFFGAKVLDVYAKTCKVQFDDGSVSSVKLADIKMARKYTKSESPKTTAKSRSRSRSAGRKTRSRSRSPARGKKTPSKSEKKTPSKAEKKKSEEGSNSVSKDETDRIVKIGLTREKIGGSQKEDSKTSATSSVVTTNSYATKEFQISLQKHDDIETRFRPTRLSTLRSSESVSLQAEKKFSSDSKSETVKQNAVSKDAAKYSDDESDEEPKAPKIPNISRTWKILSCVATLFKIILMPTFLLFLLYACTRKQCTVLEVPQFYSRWKDFGNSIKIPFPSVVLFHVAVCLLSLIPIGRKVSGFPTEPSKVVREYRLNGFLTLISALLVFGICSYFGVYMNWGFDKFKSIGLSCLLYAVLCSLFIHTVSLLKGDGTKPSNVPVLGNFYSGAYINPFLFGKLDVKTTWIRAALIGAMVMDLSILLKFFLMKGYVTIPLALCCGMQLFFILDMFIREEKMLSTATYTSDCVGYAFVMTFGFLIPMGLVLPNVYLFIYDAKASFVPHWCSAAVVGLFLSGYYIYMSSSNLKHNFRRNPFSSSLSDVDSIPTSKKKRLIASRLWGIIRHPNYLGIFIMCVAWTLPCGFSHLVPFGPLIMLTVALIVRCFRIETECKEKYGPAWNNYTEKVRSRLIPYIF